jgi:hypothetical protein
MVVAFNQKQHQPSRTKRVRSAASRTSLDLRSPQTVHFKRHRQPKQALAISKHEFIVRKKVGTPFALEASPPFLTRNKT